MMLFSNNAMILVEDTGYSVISCVDVGAEAIADPPGCQDVCYLYAEVQS